MIIFWQIPIKYKTELTHSFPTADRFPHIPLGALQSYGGKVMDKTKLYKYYIEM